MKAIAIIVILASMAVAASAAEQTFICTPVGSDTQYEATFEELGNGDIVFPGTNQTVSKHADTKTCFETFDNFSATCHGGDIISSSAQGDCKTVVCSDGNKSLQAKACLKKQFIWFGPEHVEVYRQGDKNGLEICFGDQCVGQYGYAESNTLPYCREPQQREQLDCISAITEEKLRAHIVNGTAFITNDANSTYEVSAAVYNQYNNVVEDQDVYDWGATSVAPNSTAKIPLKLPGCAWQYDIVCGDVIHDFNDEHYGDRNIYWEYSTNLSYCEKNTSDNESNKTAMSVIGDIFNLSDNDTGVVELNDTANDSGSRIEQLNQTVNESANITEEPLNEAVSNETGTNMTNVTNASNATANVSVNASVENISQLNESLNASVNLTVNTTNVT